jgi:peptidoglycan hydrolase-like protein with peptidoglycan-binding domain
MALAAPDSNLSLHPNSDTLPYALYDLWLAKPGFVTVNLLDVEIFDGQQAIVTINMTPIQQGNENIKFEDTPIPEVEQVSIPIAQVPNPSHNQSHTPEDTILSTTQTHSNQIEADAQPVYINQNLDLAQILPDVVIPEFIVVHLGVPSDSSANNVRVRFVDYIKNVTCSEIYPTWPRNAIIANVHAIVTFTLNRIYTQWYRIRGYNFDITNNTGYDQFFVLNREIFSNISDIVDEIFDLYVHRQGFNNPYFTEYCNGTSATCNGLSQWGTVELANQGMTPLQILQYYYRNDLELAVAPEGTPQSFPGVMREGDESEAVARMQTYLNRISANYPFVGKISSVNGVFGSDTVDAVKRFQKTFNLMQDGIIGRATWNKIKQIYAAVTKLSELEGEGERIGLSPNPPTTTVRQGDKGAGTIHIQFLLNFIGDFYEEIIPPIQDSVFGASTTEAVKAFQKRFGLTADGIVGPKTWQTMYSVYRKLQESVGENTPPPSINRPRPDTGTPYPGYILRQGQSGDNVATLQRMLNNSHRVYSAVPQVKVDGIFGAATANAVRIFQLYSGLVADGLVGPLTWQTLNLIG